MGKEYFATSGDYLREGLRADLPVRSCRVGKYLPESSESQLSHEDQRWLLELFQLVDANQDGYIEAAEFRTAFRLVERDLDLADISQWLQAQTSRKRQGKLGRREFLEAMGKHARSPVVRRVWPPFDALYSTEGLFQLRAAYRIVAPEADKPRICLPDLSRKIQTRTPAQGATDQNQGCLLPKTVPQSTAHNLGDPKGFHMSRQEVSVTDDTTCLLTGLHTRPGGSVAQLRVGKLVGIPLRSKKSAAKGPRLRGIERPMVLDVQRFASESLPQKCLKDKGWVATHADSTVDSLEGTRLKPWLVGSI
mmetsp:Transcript_22372/g.53467  ORF Transcript_22372/g.53467 Transcript_22372/m.53467 type:complete len:306 (-) Transcript_22372:325-1242(-)